MNKLTFYDFVTFLDDGYTTEQSNGTALINPATCYNLLQANYHDSTVSKPSFRISRTMVQCETLRNMLTSLFDSNNLKSWSIYNQYTTSDIVVKLRFSEHSLFADHGLLEPRTAVTYTRKSDTQLKRDIHRANNYKKRKMSSSPVLESERMEISADCMIHMETFPDTPEVIYPEKESACCDHIEDSLTLPPIEPIQLMPEYFVRDVCHIDDGDEMVEPEATVEQQSGETLVENENSENLEEIGLKCPCCDQDMKDENHMCEN